MSQPTVTVISWISDNARSRGVASLLEGDAEFMPWSRPGGSLAIKATDWIRSAVATARIVFGLPRGSLAVVMSPPVFAPLVAWACARLRGVRVAIDAHSGAFNDDRWRWSFGMMAWLARRCDALIVTNTELIEGVNVGRTPVVVLHDPLNEAVVDLTPVPEPTLPRVLFPASGAPDEPLDALAQVAARLKGEFEVVVTGGRVPGALVEAGVTATGFLPRAEYLAWLRSADVVLALTTREATMQRAAYEAAEAGKPLVCSDTAVLRHTFGPMSEMAANDARSLEEAVRRAVLDRERLAQAAGSVVAGLKLTEAAAARQLRDLAAR